MLQPVGIPFIIIGNDLKLKGLAEQTNQLFINLNESLTSNRLDQEWSEYLNKWEYYKQKLNKQIPKLIKEAGHNKIVLESVLK